MNEENIEEFVDNLDGAYPAAKLFVKNLYKVYKREQFMKNMTPDQARRLFNLIVNNYDAVPPLGEVRLMYWRNFVQTENKAVCEMCDNTGWVYPEDLGLRLTRQNGLKHADGQPIEYEYVVRCRCLEVN